MLYAGEKDYYEKQFATLSSFEEVDAIVENDSLAVDDLDEQAKQETAMRISNYANVFLLALKVMSCCFTMNRVQSYLALCNLLILFVSKYLLLLCRFFF